MAAYNVNIFLQVVTIATYSYLVASVFGRQFIGAAVSDEITGYIFNLLWAILENLVYVGILKV